MEIILDPRKSFLVIFIAKKGLKGAAGMLTGGLQNKTHIQITQ